jgi:hypothetical protein
MIDVSGLRFRYPDSDADVVRGIDFSVSRGEIFDIKIQQVYSELFQKIGKFSGGIDRDIPSSRFFSFILSAEHDSF